MTAATNNKNDWFETAWGHFHAFMDDDDNGNDNDGNKNWQALEELIVLAEPHVNARLSNMLPISQLTTRERLVPVLVSVASHFLAEHYMITTPITTATTTTTMLQSQQQQQQQQPVVDQTDPMNLITRHLQRAVTLFSKNAAAWGLGAQYHLWMNAQHSCGCSNSNSDNNSNNNSDNNSKNCNCITIVTWCEHACRMAQKVKQETNLVLEQQDDESLRLVGRVLLELLLMNQVVGVELNEEDEDDDEDENEDELEGNDDDDDEEEEDFWTASTVESKARYLAALMRSAMGYHEMAAQHLQPFWPNLTHRLHPNVWTTSNTNVSTTTTTTNSSTSRETITQQQQQQQQQQAVMATTVTALSNCSVQWEPTVVSGRPGVLPVELHRRLCQLFASPDSTYWKEISRQHQQQGKQNGGHFSFFVPLQQTPQQSMTSNVVEHAICQYVLPLVQQKLHVATQHSKTMQPIICGFDWWVDYPSLTGQRLDFHKVLLPAEQTVAIPIVSSVLFLQGNGMAAVVLDQTPDDSSELATVAWKCPAVENTLFMFAGNLLHGIIPQCKAKDTNTSNISKKPTIQDLFQKRDPSLACATLHVGFWTRSITGQEVYSPCGPLPLATDDTNIWVKQISQRYPVSSNLEQQNPPSSPTTESAVICETVPRIAPAWQEIEAPSKRRKPPLEVPRNIDQRFFLNFEPGCFQDFLFDEDEDELLK